MIVLDTNVVSELIRLRPDQRVRSWAAQLAEPAALTSITVWELRYGVARMPGGRRRDEVGAAVERVLHEAAGLILPFDVAAASSAARMRADREQAGRQVSTADVQIAGICEVHRAALATRNSSDFDGLGLDLVDPWAS